MVIAQYYRNPTSLLSSDSDSIESLETSRPEGWQLAPKAQRRLDRDTKKTRMEGSLAIAAISGDAHHTEIGKISINYSGSI